MRRGLASAALAGLLLAGCGEPASTRPLEPPPRETTIQRTWPYALDLLRQGDDRAAHHYFEWALDLGADRLPPSESALFLRDLAEARLANSNLAGAEAAARTGLEHLERLPLTPTFRSEDRRVFQRLLEALAAAGRSDRAALEALARAPEHPPLADPWYLLGWLAQQQGDSSVARVAFEAYLRQTPHFGLLRRSALMRRHAESALRPA